jgi:SepF-like predicted cell division protein (DUF552 family)
MGFKDWLRKLLAEKKTDTVEFPEDTEPQEKLNIRIDNLSGLEDVERIADLVKKGNIMFLKIKDLQKKDIGQFQTAIQKMKRVCSQFNWDLVGLEDGYLVVTPSFAKIER